MRNYSLMICWEPRTKGELPLRYFASHTRSWHSRVLKVWTLLVILERRKELDEPQEIPTGDERPTDA